MYRQQRTFADHRNVNPYVASQMEHASAQRRHPGAGMDNFPGCLSLEERHLYKPSRLEGQWKWDRDASKVLNQMPSYSFNQETTTTGSIFSSSAASTSMGGSIFGFSAPSTAPSLAQSHSANAFNVGDSQPSAAGSGVATSTQSMPIQFGSSPSFGAAGNTALSSGILLFGSSASVVQSFGSVATFGVSSSSSVSNAVSTRWQARKAPIFGSTFKSTSSRSGFSLGASSTSIAGSTSARMVFGSSNSASSSSIFPFTSVAAATPSPPAFGSSTPRFAFGSAPTSNNDQMEDSMAEDTVQATTPTLPVFGQQPVTPPSSGFIFAATPSVSNPFQFGSQQTTSGPQNPSPFQTTFQPSSSLEFNAGGSFFLGSGGVDKSARKIVRVKGKQRKK